MYSKTILHLENYQRAETSIVGKCDDSTHNMVLTHDGLKKLRFPSSTYWSPARNMHFLTFYKESDEQTFGTEFDNMNTNQFWIFRVQPNEF